MPYSKAQKRTAQAVKHGFHPTGSAKGFSRDFAEQVVQESDGEKKRRKAAESKLGHGAHAASKAR